MESYESRHAAAGATTELVRGSIPCNVSFWLRIDRKTVAATRCLGLALFFFWRHERRMHPFVVP